MPKQSIATLKNWFKRGLKPLEAQFSDWLDSYWHKDATDIPVASIQNLQSILNDLATIAAVALKEDKANKGIANGYAPLDAAIKVPLAQLQHAIDLLRSGVPSDGDTLNKLYNLITSLGEFAGNHDASTGLPTSGTGTAGAIDKGDYWYVTTAGTIVGLGTLAIGDVLFAKVSGANEAAEFFYLPFASLVSDASESVKGITQFSTDEEAKWGGIGNKAITPKNLEYRVKNIPLAEFKVDVVVSSNIARNNSSFGLKFQGITLAEDVVAILTGQTNVAENGVYICQNIAGPSVWAKIGEGYSSSVYSYLGDFEGLRIFNKADRCYYTQTNLSSEFGSLGKYFFKETKIDVVNVDSYGAKGDGINDDTLAFINAFAAAGAKGTTVLTKGKTYLIKRGEITWPLGMRLTGYGATIKRADATTTTLTANAAIGATSIDVGDASEFQVGDAFVICNTGATNGGRGYLENSSLNFGVTAQIVTSKVGNTINFSNALAAAFSTGQPIVRVFNLFNCGGSLSVSGIGNVLEGVDFDGNRANNSITNGWAFNLTITGWPSKSVIQYCTFRNIPTENLFCTNQSTFAHNNFINCGGSAIHVSSIDTSDKGDIIFIGNKMRNMCQATNTVTGHSEAAITFSAYPDRFICTDNHLQGCLEGFIFTGGLSPYLLVENNNVANCSYAFLWSAAFTPVCKFAKIANNIFNNCGFILGQTNVFTKTIQQDTAPDWIFIENNTMVNMKIVIQQTSGFVIRNNQLITEKTYTYPAPSGSDNAWQKIVNAANGSICLQQCSQYVIDGNVLDNRNTSNDARLQFGINCQYIQALNLASLPRLRTGVGVNTEYSYFNRNVSISNNQVLGYSIGIADYYSTSEIPPTRDVSWINFKIHANQVVLRDGTAGIYGIVAGPGCFVTCNEVYGKRSNVGLIVALGVNDGTGSTYNVGGTQRLRLNGAIVINNKCIGNNRSIQVGTLHATWGNNTYGAIVQNNFVQGAIQDDSGGNSTVSGNVTLVAETLTIDIIRNNTAYY